MENIRNEAMNNLFSTYKTLLDDRLLFIESSARSCPSHKYPEPWITCVCEILHKSPGNSCSSLSTFFTEHGYVWDGPELRRQKWLARFFFKFRSCLFCEWWDRSRWGKCWSNSDLVLLYVIWRTLKPWEWPKTLFGNYFKLSTLFQIFIKQHYIDNHPNIQWS